MKDNEIISGIRERRESFAEKYGFDPHRIAEAAMALVDRTRYTFAELPLRQKAV